jgi:hypothetical protein
MREEQTASANVGCCSQYQAITAKQGINAELWTFEVAVMTSIKEVMNLCD